MKTNICNHLVTITISQDEDAQSPFGDNDPWELVVLDSRLDWWVDLQQHSNRVYLDTQHTYISDDSGLLIDLPTHSRYRAGLAWPVHISTERRGLEVHDIGIQREFDEDTNAIFVCRDKTAIGAKSRADRLADVESQCAIYNAYLAGDVVSYNVTDTDGLGTEFYVDSGCECYVHDARSRQYLAAEIESHIRYYISTLPADIDHRFQFQHCDGGWNGQAPEAGLPYYFRNCEYLNSLPKSEID